MKNQTGRKLSRRGFLGTLVVPATLAASPLPVPASALGMGGELPPSERITIGVFGVGNRGTSSITSMKPLPDHQILAIADCRRDRALKAQELVNGIYAERLKKNESKACAIYNDFQEVLARDDIDVIWGCAPDHWHGPMYSSIIQSGKDLYAEKPLTRYINQGVKVSKMVRQYKTILQTGTQSMSLPNVRRVCELVRNGYLGKIHTIEVGVWGGRAYPSVTSCAPPDGFDWDMWSGPAPLLPFDPQRVEWIALYMISHYCAGFVTNWGVHYLGIGGWGVPEVLEKPYEIQGTGFMPKYGITDSWIAWNATFSYESGLKVKFSDRGNPYADGCKFIGDEGSIMINWGMTNWRNVKAEPASLLDVKFKDTDFRFPVAPTFTAGNVYTAHSADFFRAVRTRKDPLCPVELGHAMTTLGNTADIAMRMNTKLKYDPGKNMFVGLGSEQANRMLSRPERGPWRT